jgi:hypothetical protein
MRKFYNSLLMATMVMVSLSAQAAPPGAGRPSGFSLEKFRYKAKSPASRMKVSPSVTLPGSDSFEYIDAPDGSTWFYTVKYEYEQREAESYTYEALASYRFDIYDSDLQYYGSVSDKVHLREGEIKAVDVSLVPQLTKKFFNFDDKYEVMVAYACNTPNYVNNYRTLVYSLGGAQDEEGNDKVVLQMDGLLSDVLNASRDVWSEEFYMTFAYEYQVEPVDDTLQAIRDSYMSKIEVYSKASYGSDGPKLVLEKDLSLSRYQGDQQYVAPVMSIFSDSTPYYVICEYEKPFVQVEEPEISDDFSFNIVETQTEDNNLIVSIYKLGQSVVTDPVQVTSIPVVKDTDPDVYFSYYSVGALGYRDDVVFAKDGTASFVVTKWNYLISDDDNYANYYYKYDSRGEREFTIFELADSSLAMTDVEGFAPQYMFVKAQGGDYDFCFVNMTNGEIESQFNYQIDENGKKQALLANLDRVAYGDSYCYVAEMRTPGLDADGNDIMRIAWINPDGTLNHVDEVNMGTRVQLAQCYIDAGVLSPYLFNTDDAYEYMVLVKRTISGSRAQEELLVAQPKNTLNPDGYTLLQLGPDAEKGSIGMIMPLNLDSDPRLLVVYRGDNYTQDFYTLPLESFKGGDGTQENPYQIANIGDFREIRRNLNGYYAVVSDIDASALELASIGSSTKPFTGHIDGGGHTISNLRVNDAKGGAIFATVSNASISNLNFLNAEVVMKAETSNALIARSFMNSTLDNVHVRGLLAEADREDDTKFGGLVGEMAIGSVIKDCSVSNARISVPGSSSFYAVGGLAAVGKTGSSVVSSSFIGSIEAGENLGGIIGEADKDGVFTDCHVDADLKAANTVGGIIGTSARATVRNCYVEGTVEVTSKARKGGYKAGGIVGSLATYYGEQQEGARQRAAASPVIIEGNFVNLERMTAPEDAAALGVMENSIHRIAGYTSYNNAEIDWENTEDFENPVYLPVIPETGLANNHAIASLAIPGEDYERIPESVDGGMMTADELNAEFFAGLGFRYGEDSANPWREVPETDPSLHHEQGALFLLPEITAVEGKQFNADLLVISRSEVAVDEVADSFFCDSDDESVAYMNGEMAYESNLLTLGFDAVKEGSANITANVLGNESRFRVNVIKDDSGVKGVEDAAGQMRIAYDGSSLVCPGADLTLYSINGVKVADGNGEVRVSSLQKGVYTAVAVCADGNRATLTIIIR